MSDEENENNTVIDPVEVKIAAGATLSSPARASISRKQNSRQRRQIQTRRKQ